MNARWQLPLLAAVILVGVGLAQTRPGHTLLGDTGLYEQPATYTELAFTAPDALPQALKKSGASIPVSFSIHNVSGRPRTYQWTIEVVQDGNARVAASGAELTPASGREVISRSIAATCASSRLQVVVRLAAPAESISSWMTCSSAPVSKQACE